MSCALTMSWMVISGKRMRGCSLLLDGEEETPFAKASTTRIKYFELSKSLPGPINGTHCALVPEAQVVIRRTLFFSGEY